MFRKNSRVDKKSEVLKDYQQKGLNKMISDHFQKNVFTYIHLNLLRREIGLLSTKSLLQK